jgi:hypothetical protein
MHILALQPNLMSRSAGYATEHDGKIVIVGGSTLALTPAQRPSQPDTAPLPAPSSSSAATA